MLADTAGGFGFAVADLSANGLQNGAPDGIVLVDGTGALADKVTGVAERHINAQEPDLLSYNPRFTAAEFFNGADPFAASDHDPLPIGLTLGPADPLMVG